MSIFKDSFSWKPFKFTLVHGTMQGWTLPKTSLFPYLTYLWIMILLDSKNIHKLSETLKVLFLSISLMKQMIICLNSISPIIKLELINQTNGCRQTALLSIIIKHSWSMNTSFYTISRNMHALLYLERHASTRTSTCLK